MIRPEFWNGKRVLLTGHTGFKGAWLATWLTQMGATVCGVGLPPSGDRHLYGGIHLEERIQSHFIDIRDSEPVEAVFRTFSPDIVIHMAAQALVRLSYQDPLGTYSTNIMGTAHVLEAARLCESVQAVVNVTSDKCYENRHLDRGYIESDPMGGADPYSSSKGCAELVASAYYRSFYQKSGKGLASARAGNVIGMGDFSCDRLIPDFVRSLAKNQPILLRYPQAIRPWQHVLEPLAGYLMLAQAVFEDPQKNSSGWNFGPSADDFRTVDSIVDGLILRFNRGQKQLDLTQHPYEAEKLMLDSKKANALGWKPFLTVDQALDWTVEGYQTILNGEDVFTRMNMQIDHYMNLLKGETRV
jgi:CDP-glucose 4,6-dehydratase